MCFICILKYVFIFYTISIIFYIFFKFFAVPTFFYRQFSKSRATSANYHLKNTPKYTALVIIVLFELAPAGRRRSGGKQSDFKTFSVRHHIESRGANNINHEV